MGGDYEVRFTASARRALGRLPQAAAAAAIEFCFGPLSTNPQRGRRYQSDLRTRIDAIVPALECTAT
jgi:hypothetical protein